LTLAETIKRRGIRRVCHFTPSRNLGHILCGGRGILATKHLSASERDVFNPTDLERLDRHTGHVCCSVEYPNAWYFRKVRANERIFLDWVVLLIEADVLLEPSVKFCPRNAAAAYGRLADEGLEAFDAMYAPRVNGQRTYFRTKEQSDAVPTDQQAEVLIPDAIPVAKLTGVAVRDRDQAATEVARLRQLQVEIPPFVIAPLFFNAYALSSALRSGEVPEEIPYDAL